MYTAEGKKIISTEKAPKAIGPYSQAVRARGLLFCSGQIPLDPKTGEMVSGDIEAQTRQVMKNIEGVLTAAGTGFARIVKTTIFLKSMDDFAAVNEVYAHYFTGTAPARSTVEVARLPKDALVEIEAIAVVE